MADEDQWVAVFADIIGNNFDEFIRCTCIEGPEQFVKELEDENRSFKNGKHIHNLKIDGLERSAYLISAQLFEIAVKQYRHYIAECAEKKQLPPYFEKHPDVNVDHLIERDLVFRATMDDFKQMQAETDTHGRLVLDELEIGLAREIISRAYDRDSLVFAFKQGECVLHHCAFKPFELAFQKNNEFRARVCKFILWASFSESVSRLWIQHSHEAGVYITTIETLYSVGKEHLEQFGDNLLAQFVEGVSVNEISVRILMTLEELLGNDKDKNNIIVPRSDVERVLGKKAEPPFFLSQYISDDDNTEE